MRAGLISLLATFVVGCSSPEAIPDPRYPVKVCTRTITAEGTPKETTCVAWEYTCGAALKLWYGYNVGIRCWPEGKPPWQE